MQQGTPFYTDDVTGFVKLFITLLTGVATIYGIIKVRITSDVTARRDIDGVGGRVKSLESSCTQHDTRLGALERFMAESRQADNAIQSRIGGVEEAQRNIEVLVRASKDDIAMKVQDIKDTIAGEHTKLRERVVRLETISELRTRGLLKQEVPEDA